MNLTILFKKVEKFIFSKFIIKNRYKPLFIEYVAIINTKIFKKIIF